MKYIVSFCLSFLFVVAPVAHAISFGDVGGGTKYSEAIYAIADRGIVQGYSDGTYKPLRKINRAEFTKIIIEAQFPGQASGASCFSDVGDEWFAKYVCFAKERGIVKGNPDGTFRPASEINTAEAYKIVLGTLIDEPVYHLVNGNEWYEKYLMYADTHSLSFSSQLNPSHLVTRGEMAEMIHLVLQNNEIGEYEQAVLDFTNVERKKVGLHELKYNKFLENTAYLHAKDMFERSFMDHVNRDGLDAEDRMHDYYTYEYQAKDGRTFFEYLTGENLWMWEDVLSYDVSDLTYELFHGDSGWMKSEGHRSNILHPELKELGVGYYRAPNGNVYFVQNFGFVEFGRE
jgi:uncharacterized protein YkwD